MYRSQWGSLAAVCSLYLLLQVTQEPTSVLQVLPALLHVHNRPWQWLIHWNWVAIQLRNKNLHIMSADTTKLGKSAEKMEMHCSYCTCLKLDQLKLFQCLLYYIIHNNTAFASEPELTGFMVLNYIPSILLLAISYIQLKWAQTSWGKLQP